MKNIDINTQFKNALKHIEKSNESVFITGKAGTGKSTFLKYALKHIKKNMVVLAPTGVAALNVKGETIHSFFRFKPGITPKDAKKTARKNIDNILYKNIDSILSQYLLLQNLTFNTHHDHFYRYLPRRTIDGILGEHHQPATAGYLHDHYG